MNPDRYWTTGDEMAFIGNLGTHREQSLKIPRSEWLLRYLTAMDLRQEWGNLNIKDILKCVKAEIRAAQVLAQQEV